MKKKKLFAQSWIHSVICSGDQKTKVEQVGKQEETRQVS